MKDRDFAPLGGDSGKAAIGVAEDKHGVRLNGTEDFVAACDDKADGFRSGLASGSKEEVRLTYLHIVKEDAAQLVVVVLAGVNKYVIYVLVEGRDDPGEANDLRPSAYDRGNLHAFTGASVSEGAWTGTK